MTEWKNNEDMAMDTIRKAYPDFPDAYFTKRIQLTRSLHGWELLQGCTTFISVDAANLVRGGKDDKLRLNVSAALAFKILEAKDSQGTPVTESVPQTGIKKLLGFKPTTRTTITPPENLTVDFAHAYWVVLFQLLETIPNRTSVPEPFNEAIDAWMKVISGILAKPRT